MSIESDDEFFSCKSKPAKNPHLICEPRGIEKEVNIEPNNWLSKNLLACESPLPDQYDIDFQYMKTYPPSTYSINISFQNFPDGPKPKPPIHENFDRYERDLIEWRNMEITFLSVTIAHKLVPIKSHITMYLLKIINRPLALGYFSDPKQILVLSDNNLLTPEQVYRWFKLHAIKSMYLILPELEKIDCERYRNYCGRANPKLQKNDWVKFRQKRLNFQDWELCIALDDANTLPNYYHYYSRNRDFFSFAVECGAVKCVKTLLDNFQNFLDTGGFNAVAQNYFKSALSSGNLEILQILYRKFDWTPNILDFQSALTGSNYELVDWIVREMGHSFSPIFAHTGQVKIWFLKNIIGLKNLTCDDFIDHVALHGSSITMREFWEHTLLRKQNQMFSHSK